MRFLFFSLNPTDRSFEIEILLRNLTSDYDVTFKGKIHSEDVDFKGKGHRVVGNFLNFLFVFLVILWVFREFSYQVKCKI